MVITPLTANEIRSQGTPVLVLDQKVLNEKLRKFRSTHDQIVITDKLLPNLTGLNSLNISGSAQFSEGSLKNALTIVPSHYPIYIIDLRQESHGFINGIPISWYVLENKINQGLTDKQILAKEAALIGTIAKQSTVTLNQISEKEEGRIKKSKALKISVKKAETEAMLSNRLKMIYHRIAVLDHYKPSDAAVDEFLAFIENLPPQVWLHFHCKGGKGRTTTFMILYDILKNGHFVSLEDIVARQVLLGGSKVFTISTSDKNLWKRQAAVERKAFIERFYQYATSEKGYSHCSWSEWNRQAF